MSKYLPALVALLAILATGVVHGVWTDRWTDTAAVAARLDRLPMELGDWVGQPRELDPSTLGPIAGCLSRRYVNQRTGTMVTVSLVCGRPGPVSIHTPDVCYAASGYEAEDAKRYTPPAEAGLPPGEFMTAQFVRTRAAEQTHLRVLWSWSAGGAWMVADAPRFAFARYPVLYKLHLVREMAAANESLADDPLLEFMQQLLPELQRSVLSSL